MSTKQRGRNFNKQDAKRNRSRSRPSEAIQDVRSEATLEQHKKEQQREEQHILDNKKRSFNAPKPDEKKKEDYISRGQQVLSKFFKGFSQQERGNITVEIDDEVPGRISQAYFDSIEAHCIKEKKSADDAYDMQEDLISAAHAGLALKLHKSAPANEQVYNSHLSSLNGLKVALPVKMNQIINNFGKTDLPGDNRIRILGQSSAVKRHMFKALYHNWGPTRMAKKSRIKLSEDYIKSIFDEERYFKNAITPTNAGLIQMRTIIKNWYNEKSLHDMTFTNKTGDYKGVWTFRLPSFPFDETDEDDDPDISIVHKFFEKNKIFSVMTIADDRAKQLFMSLYLYCLTKDNLKDAYEKTFEDVFGDRVPDLIRNNNVGDGLSYVGFWITDWILDDASLNEYFSDFIHRWNSGQSSPFRSFLYLSEFNWTEFGDESQLIEVDKRNVIKKKKGSKISKFKDRLTSNCKIKTKEHSAVLGLAVGFSNSVNISSNFEVDFNGTNINILREFVKSDFK